MGQAGFLAGGEVFEGPFGKVFAKNITPDVVTGIGGWSDQEIIDAIRLGKRPDGTQLFPVMPYPTFSNMSDEDVQNLVAFLRTVPDIENAVPAGELNVPVPPFAPRAPAPAKAPTEGVERGAYIANAIAHCSDCHTPMNPDGSPDMTKFLAGGFNPDIGVAANITPDDETGIGKWTEKEIATLLRTGKRPDGSDVAGGMALVIQGGYKDMAEADALAVATYLKTVPAVNNVPQVPAMMEEKPAEQPPMSAPQQLPKTGAAAFGMVLAGVLTLLGGVAAWAGVSLRPRT
jgi:mono/diheme cytochrome c family protein